MTKIMDEITKHINDTNASYRHIGAGDAKNTDLFLDNEHYEFFRASGEHITVRFDKTNLTQAILFIASILPRKFDQSANHFVINYSDEFVIDQLAILDALFQEDGASVNTITQTWNARKDIPKKNGEIDNRFYFNNLLREVNYKNHNGEIQTTKFTIRNYFAGGFSNLHIKKALDGIFDIKIDNVTEPYDDRKEDGLEEIYIPSSKLHDDCSHQQIYYGAPGTGKSHKIKEILGEYEGCPEDEQVPKENIFRTTFHPDSDYSTFVGAYKPSKGKKPLYGLNGGLTVRLKNDGKDLEDEIITYKFIPQAFLNAYMQAYRKPKENVYLIIEEINRGNCAQIFGDLFQLLDRDKNGVSEYTIKADTDLKIFLEEEMGKDSDAIKGGELCLPSNLYIYATMNTSDQSLFPIDSAFKRRWDWEYEPIKYKNTDWIIDIDGVKYKWCEFQKEVNMRILKDTGSEDKMLGDYFVNPPTKVISFNTFRNKILFYMWNDVCKDGDADIFPSDMDFSFSKLYDDGSKQLIISMMDKLNLKPIDRDNENLEEDDNNLEGEDSDSSIQYSINGEIVNEKGKPWGKGGLVKRAVEIFCQNNPDLSAKEVRNEWLSVGFKIPHIVETENDKQERLSGSKDKTGRERCKPIKLRNEELLYVSTEVGSDKVYNNFEDFLSKIKSKPEWEIDIHKI